MFPLPSSRWRARHSLPRLPSRRGVTRPRDDRSMVATELVEMLDLEAVGPNKFRARPLAGSRAVVFGGQLLAQSLAAAAHSIDGMRVKSMHTVFLRGGRPEEILEIDVEPLHAGRTFGASDVTVRQGQRICTKSVVLHHVPDEEVISHQADPPDIGTPEEAVATPLGCGARLGGPNRPGRRPLRS